MSQDLARIRAFVQVFDAGGFSSAARQHGRSKALLSKYVTDLEDYLGVRLMNRTTRKLSLTEGLALTERGARIREVLAANWEQLEEALFADLDTKKRKGLTKALKRFVELLRLA